MAKKSFFKVDKEAHKEPHRGSLPKMAKTAFEKVKEFATVDKSDKTHHKGSLPKMAKAGFEALKKKVK